MEIQNKYLILINLTIVNIIYIKILFQGSQSSFFPQKEGGSQVLSCLQAFVCSTNIILLVDRNEDIFISIWNLHRCPKRWEDADKFNPERWPLDGPNPNETNQSFRYVIYFFWLEVLKHLLSGMRYCILYYNRVCIRFSQPTKDASDKIICRKFPSHQCFTQNVFVIMQLEAIFVPTFYTTRHF